MRVVHAPRCPVTRKIAQPGQCIGCDLCEETSGTGALIKTPPDDDSFPDAYPLDLSEMASAEDMNEYLIAA